MYVHVRTCVFVLEVYVAQAYMYMHDYMIYVCCRAHMSTASFNIKPFKRKIELNFVGAKRKSHEIHLRLQNYLWSAGSEYCVTSFDIFNYNLRDLQHTHTQPHILYQK